MILKSVAEIVATEPQYADVKQRFEYVAHSWFQNSGVMSALMDSLQPKTVIEIGVWQGASSRFMAAKPYVERVVAIDHWSKAHVENYREGVHPDSWLTNMFSHFLANCLHAGADAKGIPLANKIYPMKMMSSEAAKLLHRMGPPCTAFGCDKGRVKITDGMTDTDKECDRCWGTGNGPFQADWIYVDGAHKTDMALADFRAYRPFVRKGGFLTGDDYAHTLPGEDVRGAAEQFARERNGSVIGHGNFLFFHDLD